MKNKNRRISFGVSLALAGVILLSGSSLRADDQDDKNNSQCKGLPSHADLQAHDVAALRSSDETGANVSRTLVESAHVARVIVVIYDLIAVCHFRNPPAGSRVFWLDSAELAADAYQSNLRGAKPLKSLRVAARLKSRPATTPSSILLVRLPFDLGQVNAFFHHLVER